MIHNCSKGRGGTDPFKNVMKVLDSPIWEKTPLHKMLNTMSGDGRHLSKLHFEITLKLRDENIRTGRNLRNYLAELVH